MNGRSLLMTMLLWMALMIAILAVVHCMGGCRTIPFEVEGSGTGGRPTMEDYIKLKTHMVQTWVLTVGGLLALLSGAVLLAAKARFQILPGWLAIGLMGGGVTALLWPALTTTKWFLPLTGGIILLTIAAAIVYSVLNNKTLLKTPPPAAKAPVKPAGDK